MNVVERAVRGGDQAQQRGAPLAFGAGVFQKCGDSTSVCQDFDADMQVLTSIVGTEIEWDLGVALPEIEGSPERSNLDEELKRSDDLATHAPGSLHPGGPRWRQRAPVLSRLITLYDRLRDLPGGTVRSR